MTVIIVITYFAFKIYECHFPPTTATLSICNVLVRATIAVVCTSIVLNCLSNPVDSDNVTSVRLSGDINFIR